MCLSLSSLEKWYRAHPNCVIPASDMAIALRMYADLWPNLDHSRRYCLNPQIVAAELLERAGVGCYPDVKRFTGPKGQHYRDAIELLAAAAPTTASRLLARTENLTVVTP